MDDRQNDESDPLMSAKIRKWAAQRFVWVPGEDANRVNRFELRAGQEADVWAVGRLTGLSKKLIRLAISSCNWSIHVVTMNRSHVLAAIVVRHDETENVFRAIKFSDSVPESAPERVRLILLGCLERPDLSSVARLHRDDLKTASLLRKLDWKVTSKDDDEYEFRLPAYVTRSDDEDEEDADDSPGDPLPRPDEPA